MMPKPPLIESESRRKVVIAAMMGVLLAVSLGLAWPTTRGVGQRTGSSLSALGVTQTQKWADPQRETRWLVTGLIQREARVSEAGSLLLELMSSLTEGEVSPGAAQRDAVRRIQTPRVTGATLTRAVRLGPERQAEHQVTILTGRSGSGRTLLMLYLHDVYRADEAAVAQQNSGLMTRLALHADWETSR
jgi:hypothetical protein